MTSSLGPRSFLFCCAVAAALVSGAAAAQDVAAPSAASQCRKPELADRPRVTGQEVERTTAEVQEYVDCMRPVLDAQRKRAEQLYADAKAAAEASNAQATEVNALVDAYRKWAQEHQDDEAQ